MPKKIPAAAIPPLQLTPQDEHDLRSLADQLEREICAEYETFAFRNDRCLDAARWKHSRSDGDVHAYKERVASRRPTKDTSGPHETLVSKSTVPRVLVTGTVPGTLDDIMYGSSFQDTPSLQRFWAEKDERTEESAVVAKLDGATLGDPYQFLGVVWCLRTFPLRLLQTRDFLTLTSVRLTELSNGERVGIVAVHSIEHRDLTPLHEFNTIRATTSILHVYRQSDFNSVEFFTVQLLDTRGSVSCHRHVYEATKFLVPLATTACNAGFRKKLEWLVQRRERDHLAAMPCDAIEPQSSGTNNVCELCDKRVGTLFSCPGTTCQVCYKRICLRCSVRQDIAVATRASSKPTLRPRDFCVQCMLDARATSTLTAAQEEAQFRYGSTDKGRDRVLTTLMSADALLYCT